MTRWVTVGKTGSPHGVSGWLKVNPLTDNPERFKNLEKIFLFGREDAPPREIAVKEVKYQANRVVLKLEGIDNREDAAKLANRLVKIPESEVVPIEEENTYYYYQLEGMEVRDSKGMKLGTLASVFQTGSNDIYVVQGEDGKEYFVPSIKSAVLEVNLENRLMIVDRDWIT